MTGSDPEVSDDANDIEEPMHQPFVNISHSGKWQNYILISLFSSNMVSLNLIVIWTYKGFNANLKTSEILTFLMNVSLNSDSFLISRLS